mmetsp:Transcript_1074/g.2963  ORF Transcript_1074/g.2963 Transcript_1074/m.2963 type:complete len:378 (+) Transcript_1074:67-1200(+)
MPSSKVLLAVSFWFQLSLDSTAFLAPAPRRRAQLPSTERVPCLLAATEDVDIEYLKTQLLEYLEQRSAIGADELAQGEVGKVIGGTKGNAVLNFVSGAPAKERVLDKAPDALDYGELTKYGFGHLVTPIMKAGGRFEMYRILELEAPETRTALKRISAPKVVIDRETLNVPKRYSGLKLGQIMDDSVQGQALEESLKKEAEPTQSDYVIPFSNKRNTGPRQTPEWTAERLDELGARRGQAEAWAQRARAGDFVKDINETYDLTLQQRAFSILTALLIATAFGKSTDTFFVDMIKLVPDQATITSLKGALQGPALGLFVASIASCILSYMQASESNRNSFMWAIKGALGGPFTLSLLRSLDPLITREEEEAQKDAKQS